MSDQGLVELAMRLAQRPEVDPTRPSLNSLDGAAQPGDAIDTPESEQPQPPLPVSPAKAILTPASPVKDKKTADELAAMILADLSQVEGCPKRGVNVRVYGYNPWNAWLSFGSAAGPVRNKVELQGFFDIITARLRRLYDVPF